MPTTTNIGPCECCGEDCECNCGIRIIAFANGGCGGGTSFKLYLKVDGGAVEVVGPSGSPNIEKTFTDGPHDICMWWNESNTNNAGEPRSVFQSWYGNIETTLDPDEEIDVDLCPFGCSIPANATMGSVSLTIYMHQNEPGGEDGEIELKELRLRSGAWLSANLVTTPIVVDDFTLHGLGSGDSHSFGGSPVAGLTPARANALCLAMKFKNPGASSLGTLKIHQISVDINFTHGGGASPGGTGGVIVGPDLATINPCAVVQCGNAPSLLYRLCPGTHAPDNVSDQSGYSPVSCFTVDCGGCP